MSGAADKRRMMAKLLFFDLETTGVDSQACGIHQIAGLIEIDGKVVDQINIKTRPLATDVIMPSAMEVCGVTEDQIRAYPLASLGYSDLTRTLDRYVDKWNKKDKFFLVGYNNTAFDNQFLRKWWQSVYFGSYFWPNSIDVMVLATLDTLNFRGGFANFRLATVAEYYGIAPEGQLHDALTDVCMTRAIYNAIITKCNVR
jgi:DNA polymerase-3 subunit epsilon